MLVLMLRHQSHLSIKGSKIEPGSCVSWINQNEQYYTRDVYE